MKHNLKLIFIITTFTILITFLLPTDTGKKEIGGHPNIIVISLDAVRADHLPCYGYHRNTTPNICNLADDGVLFENAYSQGGCTLISLSSLLTSTWPADNGVRSWKGYLKRGIPIVFDILDRGNYNTFLFSDMVHFGNWSYFGENTAIMYSPNTTGYVSEVKNTIT
ncbi:MAG: sulfatase-like hydrolase/transferase, partial [Candidatus Aenigmatarchaeota archaeon]